MIRDHSDTARWVATYRARETERRHALFCDRYAERLAGERGVQIAAAIPKFARGDWPFVVRTYLFDLLIAGEVQRGVDTVLNLGAGLDVRPYRMALPSSLTWIEVDLPDILQYKSEVLAAERPACAIERWPVDLSDVAKRRALFARVAARATRTLVASEGLLIYWSGEEVGSLAKDLSATWSFERWVIDLSSPGLVRLTQRRMQPLLREGRMSYKFAPEEGPAFFERQGWRVVEVRSLFETAAEKKRLPLLIRLLSILPEQKGPRRIWSGVCLLENQRHNHVESK